MAKKKNDEIKVEESKRLSPAQYWEWRCTTEELKFAKLNEKRIHLEREIMNKEIENRKLRLALFKESVRAARRSVELAEAEYEKFTQSLEEELDMTFKDCVIDEYTYEIKSLNEEPIITNPDD